MDDHNILLLVICFLSGVLEGVAEEIGIGERGLFRCLFRASCLMLFVQARGNFRWFPEPVNSYFNFTARDRSGVKLNEKT
jgi:hypothetical protein